MPTYEYACPTCGIVEVFQSIRDDALTKCPQCKKAKVTRMVSKGGGVIFKGSGFWETDYNRSSDYKTKAGESAKAGDAKAEPATPASETPAPQPQAKPALAPQAPTPPAKPPKSK